jgi:hypothetical protein
VQLDDVRWLTISRTCAFPVRYDLRVQVDRSNASHYIVGAEGESAEALIERAVAHARRYQDAEA